MYTKMYIVYFIIVIIIIIVILDLNKRQFREAVRLRYDWPIPDNPSVCVCGSMFTVDHAMICQRGGLVIQLHEEPITRSVQLP